jgi:competence protein ComEA
MSFKELVSKIRLPGSGWTVTVAVLAVIIIAGSVFIGVKHGRGGGIEISLATENRTVGQIYVGGEVNSPGIYPLRSGDSIQDIIKAAGGLTDNADTGSLHLEVMGKGGSAAPQKVDINRADAWLLGALPGIGEARAQAIIAYRQKNGPFRDIYELLKVPGFGEVIFAGIKDLITVGE